MKADEVLHFALLLSLLRTNVDDIFSIHGVQDPELQEIILGTSLGYTQTQFHNNLNDYNFHNRFERVSKTIDNNYHINALVQDLRALGNRYNSISYNNQQYITAWLVNESNQQRQEPSNPNQDNTGNSNNNNNNDSESVADIENPASPDSAIASSSSDTSELSREDMDLIDVLWRQDIDLGIGRNAFEGDYAYNFYPQSDIDYLKEKNKQTAFFDQPNLQFTDFPGPKSVPEVPQVNYTLDSETGEILFDENGQPMISDVQPVPSTSSALELTSNKADHHLISSEEAEQALNELLNDPENEIDEIANNINLLPTPQNDPENSWEKIFENDTFLPDTLQNSFNLTQEDYDIVRNDVGLTSIPRPNVTDSELADLNNILPNKVNKYEMNNNLSLNYESFGQKLFPDINVTEDGFNSLLNNSALNFDTNGNNNTSFPMAMESNNISFNDIISPLANMASQLDLTTPSALQVNQPFKNLLEPEVGCYDYNDKEQELEFRDSDSAISMPSNCGSSYASSIQNSPPQDAVEGACGTTIKQEKYDDYDSGSSYSEFSYSSKNKLRTNNSMSRNYSFTDDKYESLKLKNIHHNHTYNTPEGQEIREVKTYAKKEPKLNHDSKDVKRAKNMNLPFSVDDIIKFPHESLDTLKESHKLTDHQMQLIKDIRRRGKNKVAAQNCRKRKMDEICDLDEEVLELQNRKMNLFRERELMQMEIRRIHDKINSLYDETIASVRVNRPVESSEVQLDILVDGSNVYIPQNRTSSDNSSRNDKTKRLSKKRK